MSKVQRLKREGTEKDDVARRFELIVGQSSQAEIARKTDTPTTTISRYVAGAKIPASFCAKLVERLGVNPAWLLVGEGGMRLSDVTEHTASMAGNMLELIKAMNVVVGMRLGELVGKDHLKVLRQLNETINQYDELKLQLNARSRDVMGELLGKLKVALAKGQKGFAARYLEACKQMARLRDDVDTATTLATLEGDYHARFVSPTSALGHFKRAFVARLASSSHVDEQYCESVMDYARALAYVSRYDEAHRVSESALALIQGRPEFSRWEALINVAAATFELDLGRLAQAQKRLAKYFPLVDEKDKGFALYGYSYAQLYSGAWSLSWAPLPEVLSLGVSSPYLRVARLSDDPEQLRQACEHFVGDAPGQVDPARGLGRSTRLHLRALDGEDVVEEFKEHCADQENRHWKGDSAKGVAACISAINYATFYRYSGKRAQALKYIERSAELLAHLPPEVDLPILYHAYHHASVLKFAKRSKHFSATLVAQAQAFFSKSLSSGYLCFKSVSSDLLVEL